MKDAGRFDEAEEHLRDAVRLDPTSVYGHYHLGRLLLDRGRQEEGDTHLLLLARGDLGLDKADSYVAIALALARHRRKDEAMVRLDEALRIRPTDAPANFYAGCLLAQRGRWSEALTRFNAVATNRPVSAEVVYHRALALSHTGHRDEARTEALRAQALGVPAATDLVHLLDRNQAETQEAGRR